MYRRFRLKTWVQRTTTSFAVFLGAIWGLQGCLTADDGHPGPGGGGGDFSGGSSGGSVARDGGFGAGGRTGGGTGATVGTGATFGGGGVAADAGFPLRAGAGGVSSGGGGFFGAGGSSFGAGATFGAGGSSFGAGGTFAAGGSVGSGGASGGGADPCTAIGQAQGTWGYYCGANLTLSADAARLYLCFGGLTSASVVCPSGCHAAPPGQPDYCIGSDPCVNSPFDGDVCGANLSTPDADANTLYNCQNGQTVSMTVCSAGCHPSPPGQADYCLGG
jgi:hypothetical protein